MVTFPATADDKELLVGIGAGSYSGLNFIHLPANASKTVYVQMTTSKQPGRAWRQRDRYIDVIGESPLGTRLGCNQKNGAIFHRQNSDAEVRRCIRIVMAPVVVQITEGMDGYKLWNMLLEYGGASWPVIIGFFAAISSLIGKYTSK